VLAHKNLPALRADNLTGPAHVHSRAGVLRFGAKSHRRFVAPMLSPGPLMFIRVPVFCASAQNRTGASWRRCFHRARFVL